MESPDFGKARSLLTGASAVLALQLLGVGLNFALQVFLARGLGAESYGAYVYALRWLGLLALLCQGGLAVGSLRYVPAYVAAADWPHLAGFLQIGWRYVVGSAAVVGLLAWGTLLGLGAQAVPEMRWTLAVGLLGLPLYGLLQVWSSTLRGLGRVVLSQLPAPVLRPLLLAAGVAVWLVADRRPLSAPGTMALHLAAMAALVALTGAWLRRALPADLAGVEARRHTREWGSVMPPLMLQNLIGMALQRLDVLLIGVLLGVWEVALYAAASRVAGLLTFGRKAVNAWAAPEISRRHAAGDTAALSRLARRASRVTFGLSLPIAAVILQASREILGAFGSEFKTAATALSILVVGHLLASLIGPASFLLSMTGGERTVVKISSATLLPTAALHAVLIPAWGLPGAAMATAASRLAYHLALAIVARRRTGALAMLF